MITPPLDYDRDFLGKPIPAGVIRIEKQHVLDYCTAIGETGAIYTDEEQARGLGYRSLVAPPSFCNILERASARPDIRLKFPGVGIHQWQAFECFEPICAGDILNATVRLKEVYTKQGRTGPAAVVMWETTFANQENNIVATVLASSMTRPIARLHDN